MKIMNTETSYIIQQEDRDKCALASKSSKAKGKKDQREVESNEKGKKKDIIKIKCFYYHEFEHDASNFHNNKEGSKNHVVTSTKGLSACFLHIYIYLKI